ncbi:hypothetical protein AAFF_G00126860 [Aldrovandia affinis]|uniref:Uncharacterized protein n=1 Tax=Aldrovandia affinis TaxID=143900 RepID=A0AAD7WX80_9TELE|nr:hypothetical protein AAFF_G00126860 [Aldrovandia affinis]
MGYGSRGGQGNVWEQAVVEGRVEKWAGSDRQRRERPLIWTNMAGEQMSPPSCFPSFPTLHQRPLLDPTHVAPWDSRVVRSPDSNTLLQDNIPRSSADATLPAVSFEPRLVPALLWLQLRGESL